MPTGYTAGVAEGTVADFPTFALQCARAMGALIMQREEPIHARPKLNTASDYHVTAYNRAKERYAELMKMTASEVKHQAELFYSNRVIEYNNAMNKNRRQLDRYNQMLDKVHQWEPPTDDHDGLKQFMIDQLTESINFDCNTYTIPEPEKIGPIEWLNQSLGLADRDMEYHKKQMEVELTRTDDRNEWIVQLYNSIGVTPPTER